MAAENSPINMKLINNYIPQVGKELLPLGMVGQNTCMEHVRVCDHVALLADCLSRVIRRIAVIGEGLYVCLEFADKTMHFCHLVIGKGFCREEVNGSCLGFLHDLLEHGDVVTQGLAAGCGCDKDHIFALMDKLYGASLMTI